MSLPLPLSQAIQVGDGGYVQRPLEAAIADQAGENIVFHQGYREATVRTSTSVGAGLNMLKSSGFDNAVILLGAAARSGQDRGPGVLCHRAEEAWAACSVRFALP